MTTPTRRWWRSWAGAGGPNSTETWTRPTWPGASVINDRVLSALHPGAIVVMHNGGGDRSQTVGTLPGIISGVRTAGYQIVPLCEG